MNKQILRIETIDLEALRPNAKPSIRVKIQEVIENEAGEVIQILPNTKEIFNLVESVANQTISIADPETAEQVTISIAGLQRAIMAIAYDWFNQYYDGTLIDGKFILND